MSLGPPFTEETARAKVKAQQDLWNTHDPIAISMAYTPDSTWRNRSEFLTGTAQIQEFLVRKWEKEKSSRLRAELFAFGGNKISSQFWYEYQDRYDHMKWKRCYGLENWAFADDGRISKRQMSGNDVEISDYERWFEEGVDINEEDISGAHW